MHLKNWVKVLQDSKHLHLSIDGDGADLLQARKFLEALNLELFLEPIEVDYSSLDWKKAVKVVEDYKSLDIQSATMNLSLLQGIQVTLSLTGNI